MAWWLCKRIGALFAVAGTLAGAVAQPSLEIRWMFGGAWREVRAIAFSPTDGVVAVSSNSKISLHDFNTRGVIREIASPSNQFYRALAYSSDGQWLAAALDSSAVLYDARRGLPLWTRVLANDSPTAVAVSPNGEYVAVGANGLNRVYLLRRSDGSVVRQWSHHTRGVSSVHFTPDGEYVVSAAPDGEVCIWNVNSVSLVRRYSFGSMPDCQSALSPDGQLLALVGFTDGGA
ncbi:MAG: WD40 repeat domain-containing protein [bacterium]|nr:WD40 repeat domain-containing protein [bacterium]